MPRDWSDKLLHNLQRIHVHQLPQSGPCCDGPSELQNYSDYWTVSYRADGSAS